MIIEDTFTINAPQQHAWDMLTDIEKMATNIPGAEVTPLDQDNYEGTLKIKIGPLGIKLSGMLTITSMESPTRLDAFIRAKDHFTNSLTEGTITANLKALSPEQTEVTYTADVIVRGKLAKLALSMVKNAAKNLARDFIQRARTQIEPGTLPPH